MERQDVAQIIGGNVCHGPEKSFIFPNLYTISNLNFNWSEVHASTKIME